MCSKWMQSQAPSASASSGSRFGRRRLMATSVLRQVWCLTNGHAGDCLYGTTLPILKDGRRRLAGRDLDIHLSTAAATDGDVWVYDAASRTLVAGDLVTLPVPFLDTACPAGWRKALEDLRDQPFTRLVPGHGAVMDHKDFRRYRVGFGRLLECAARNQRTAAQCADGWIRDLGELLPAAEHAHARELLDYYLPQRLRGAAASADCPRH